MIVIGWFLKSFYYMPPLLSWFHEIFQKCCRKKWWDKNIWISTLCAVQCEVWCCTVEKWKIWSHWQNISSNQLWSNFFSIVKKLLSRIFCQKSVKILSYWQQWQNISSNLLCALLCNFFSREVALTKFLPKNRENFHIITWYFYTRGNEF